MLPRVVLALVAVAALAAAEPAQPANGGFEHGADDWQYEQWDHRPLPGEVDAAEHAEGAASFRFGLAGESGGRWIAQAIRVHGGGTLSWRWKARDLPEGAGRMRLLLKDHGFARGDDLARIGGTTDWQMLEIAIGEGEIGDVKEASLFFYDDAIGTGSLWLDDVRWTPDDAGGPRLRGDTSHPEHSTYTRGEAVALAFTVTGLVAGGAPTTLDVDVLDALDRPVAHQRLPVVADADGRCALSWTAPSARLGYYRVRAALGDGTTLAALGSRPAGALSYAIVPAAGERRAPDEAHSRFGMQGVPSAALGTLLGVRWTLDDSLFWRRTEPDHAGQFDAGKAAAYAAEAQHDATATWRPLTLPTLFVAPEWAVVPETFAYETGTLTPAGEAAWIAYCGAAARAFAARHPERSHRVYQITWEPLQPWGFKGTDADLVRIYQLAYPAIHAADPRALVAGPCRGIHGNGDPEATLHLLDLGLGKWIDAYVVHPYSTTTPERDGMPGEIRRIAAALRAAAGHDVPMYGSEQGLSTSEDPAQEVIQARAMARQNLITLGEGFVCNFAFTGYDYRMSGQKGYGIYYNLDPGVPWQPAKVAPKPIAAAYAAQSWLLEGADAVGAVDGLDPAVRGYAFERDDVVTLALWTDDERRREIALDAGADRVDVADWMGERATTATSGGAVRVAVGPEPIYVVGVSPRFWGRDAARLLRLADRRVAAFAGATAVIRGHAVTGGDGAAAGEVRVAGDDALAAGTASAAIAAGPDGADFALALPIPRDAAIGEHRVALRSHDAAGRVVSVAAVTIEVRAPLEIAVESAFDAHGAAMAVDVANPTGDRVAGQLRLALRERVAGAAPSDLTMIDLARRDEWRDAPGEVAAFAVDLAAGAHVRRVIALPALVPARPYRVEVSAEAGGCSFASARELSSLAARRLTPTVDGDLGEWAAIAPVELAAPADVVRAPAVCPPALRAALRFAWDDHALHVAVDVADDRFVQPHRDGDTWRADCVQLGVDLAPGATGAHRASELNFALTDRGAQVWRSLTWSSERLPTGAVAPDRVRLAIAHDGGRLRYEATIPWRELGADDGWHPDAGQAIGVAATVNEARSPEQSEPSALGLFGGIVPAKDAERFGTLRLAP